MWPCQELEGACCPGEGFPRAPHTHVGGYKASPAPTPAHRASGGRGRLSAWGSPHPRVNACYSLARQSILTLYAHGSLFNILSCAGGKNPSEKLGHPGPYTPGHQVHKSNTPLDIQKDPASGALLEPQKPATCAHTHACTRMHVHTQHWRRRGWDPSAYPEPAAWPRALQVFLQLHTRPP